MNNKGLIIVGRIEKPFGLRGELKVHPEVFLEDFLQLKRFIIINPKGGEKIIYLENIRPGAGNSIIVKFEGIDTRELAEKLKGHFLYIPEEELPEAETGEYYIKDLLGCSVLNKEKIIGKVVDYISVSYTGSLVIQQDDGHEVIIPFVKKYVKNIDIESKTILVEDIDDLIDLNL